MQLRISVQHARWAGRARVVGALLLTVPLAGSAAAQAPDLRGALLRYEAGRLGEAATELEAIVAARPREAAAHHYLGRIAYDHNRFDQAAKHFETAARLGETSSYRHWLGRAYGQLALSESSILMARRSKAALDRAVELDPENVEARLDLVRYYRTAPELLGGSWSRARAEAERIATRNPMRGHVILAEIHLRHGRTQEAEASYLRAVAGSRPDSLMARHQLGLFYQNQGEWNKALEVYEAMNRIAPQDPGALYQIGRIGALSGQHLRRAEQALREYTRRRLGPTNPSYASAHWRLGMVYERLGAPEQARAEYEAAHRLDPGNADIAAARQRLRS